MLYSDCRKYVPLHKRLFATTYTAIPYFGTQIWKAVYIFNFNVWLNPLLSEWCFLTSDKIKNFVKGSFR